MRRTRIALFANILALGAVLPAAVNAQKAIVAGVARAADGGAPIPFALVRLIQADSGAVTSDPSQQGITSADGRYRFVAVKAGRYRVQLLRIGFRPVLSDPVDVAPDATVQLPLSVVSQPVALPTVTVTAEPCVAAQALAAHPQLQLLWQQARDGASVRAGLMARYRYHMLSREEGVELTANGSTPGPTLERPLISDPKWAIRNADRNRSRVLSSGYYGPNDGWFLPNELDILHEDFLKAHCFLPTAERGDGEIGLRFKPLKERRNFLDVGGTIWLDSATYLARRIELEYVDGDDSRGTVRLDFGDVAVAGGMLRMPIGGAYTMRPSRKNPDRRTQGKLSFTYSNFEEVR